MRNSWEIGFMRKYLFKSDFLRPKIVEERREAGYYKRWPVGYDKKACNLTLNF